MTIQVLSRYRIYFVVAITVAIWVLLGWQYFHGGIPEHHLLADPKLPSLSNAWGALLVPLLTGYLSFRIQKRATDNIDFIKSNLKKALLGFGISASYAICIALAFSFGYSQVSDFLFMSLLAMALIFPLYQAQYYLGYVLGLTYFFGAVLPTLVGGFVVAISAIANFMLHPLLLKAKNLLKPGK